MDLKARAKAVGLPEYADETAVSEVEKLLQADLDSNMLARLTERIDHAVRINRAKKLLLEAGRWLSPLETGSDLEIYREICEFLGVDEIE